MDIQLRVNKNNGYEKATKFDFSIAPNPLSAVTAVKWLFGDSNQSYIFNPSHTFLHEGTYNVSVHVYTNTNSVVSATTAINIYPFIDESIFLEFVPPPAFAGHYNRYPFKINITSKTADQPHYIDLSTMFSRSYKHQEKENKWTFLRPEWRFLDLDGNIIDKIKTEDTLLKINGDGKLVDNGTVVGVSGTCQFYFIDDLYNYDLALSGLPFTTIIATLRSDDVPAKNDFLKTDTTVKGFANSKASVFFPYIIYPRRAQELKITKNGILQFTNPNWTQIHTPIVINSIVTSEFPDYWKDGNGASILYKPTEFFIKTYPINDTIIPLTATISNISANFIPEQKFRLYDKNEYKVSGYYKGEIELEQKELKSCVISASANLNTTELSGIYVYPIFWLSNPAAKKIHTLQYIYQPNLSATYFENEYKNIPTLGWDRYHLFNIDVPIVKTKNYANLMLAVTGFHGIYSMAIAPFPDYHVWASDSENDMIYRYSTNGEMLCSIDLKSVIDNNGLNYLVDRNVSPSTIVMDGEKNLWVNLYDTSYTLKFDKYGNFLFATDPLANLVYEAPPNMNPAWFKMSQYFESEPTEFGDNNFVEPTGIDTDIDNNVWVTYSMFFSGILVKFDEYGTPLKTFTFPLCSCPQEVICDKTGDFWLVYSNLIFEDVGKIEKRNSQGVILSSYNNLRSPDHVALDPYQNLWFTLEYNKVGKINNTTGAITIKELSSKNIAPFTPNSWFDEERVNIDDQVFNGICADQRGNVYVINDIENQIYVLNQSDMVLKDVFYVSPQGVSYFIDRCFESTTEQYSYLTKSLQAQGDWSGFRWINKYGAKYLPYYIEADTPLVSGKSIPLDYISGTPYSLYKINEDFNLTENIKHNANMPVLKESEFLFDTFLNAIYGNSQYQDMGVKSYEKISNFVLNQSDIDTCNIENLYNFSDMVDIESDNFKLNYPEEIKRLLNIASINQSLLWGSTTIPELDIHKLVTEYDPIDLSTYEVLAGNPLILNMKSLNTYRIVPTGPIYGNYRYNIVYLITSLGLDKYSTNEYCFYDAKPWKDILYTDNIIDWNNLKNDISPIMIDVNPTWFRDQGILETMISYTLYKGLDFL